MLIGIDASRAAYPQRTGTENYSLRLICRLLAIDGEHRFRLYFSSQPPPDLFSADNNWEARVIPLPRLWTHLGLSWEVIRHPPSVLFVPAHVLPILHPSRSVVTVHDLGYLYYPQAHRPWDRLYLDLATRFSAKTANHLIAVSQATKNDLIRHYAIPAEKITVIYPGMDPALGIPVGENALRQVQEKYRLPDDYILYLGTIQPRKNLNMLVHAYGKLPDQGKTPHLVLAGKKAWLSDSIYQQVAEWGLRDRVHFPGYIAAPDLAAVLQGARLFVLPSLYEGFGLPILEAMAAGVPVLAANASSLPEVAGEAALLLDPRDAEAWANSMARSLRDEGLRQELVARGRQRAAAFTWEKCAQQTLAVLEKAGGLTPSPRGWDA